MFRVLAGLLIRDRAPRAVAAASVLAFTAVVSGLANLDVAVVVAMPVALQAAHRRGLSAGRLAVAVAMTANAASFLLPTSNITNLLLLGRIPLPTPAYVSDSWLPWLLVTGSVATLITRRIARHGNTRLSAWQFSAIGLALVPAQLAAATIGLHITGVLT